VSLDLLARRNSKAGTYNNARLARTRASAVGGRQVAGAAGLVVVLAGVVFLNPVLVLCGLVLTTSALLMRRLSWDLALPAGVLALLAVSTIVAVAAGLLDIDLLARPWILATLYVLYSAAGAYWSWRPSVPLLSCAAPTGGYGWAAYASAGLAGAIGVAQSFFERMPASWAFTGTDLAQHMILLQDVQRSGSLDYSVSGYPRSFHMLAAFVSVPSPPLDHPLELLSYDMRLVAAATWLCLALVLWAGTTLALRLGAARGAPRLVSVGAAVLFGAGALLTNSFVVTFVYMGAASSLLAIVVVVSLPLAALGLNTRRSRVIVLPVMSATSVMLLAHLWQALIVVPPLAFAVYAVPGLRDVVALATRRKLWDRLGMPFALVTAVSLIMLAAGSIPLLSLQTSGGLALAATAGDLPAVPWLVLCLGLAVAVWMIRDFLRGSTRLFLGSVGGLLLATAVMLRGANNGFDLHQYYPMKVLWFLTIMLGPILALTAVDTGRRLFRPVWRSLDRLGGLTRVCRAAVVASLCAVGFAFCLPPLLGNASTTLASLARYAPRHGQSDSTSIGAVSSARFDIATSYGTRYAAAVTVPVAVADTTELDHYGPYVVSKLISFQTGQPQSYGQAADVCSDVTAVTAGSGRAVVITQMDPDALRAIMKKKGCGDVPVVKIPGGG
jgi:hypothetical protein